MQVAESGATRRERDGGRTYTTASVSEAKVSKVDFGAEKRASSFEPGEEGVRCLLEIVGHCRCEVDWRLPGEVWRETARRTLCGANETMVRLAGNTVHVRYWDNPRPIQVQYHYSSASGRVSDRLQHPHSLTYPTAARE